MSEVKQLKYLFRVSGSGLKFGRGMPRLYTKLETVFQSQSQIYVYIDREF
jgi:hypothetical protein